MRIVPINIQQARDFVKLHHRHSNPPHRHKFSVGLAGVGGALIGVATAGRPIARMLDDGLTLEVTRTCTDGTPNANSKLYGAVWQAARAMGYQRCVTYTQADESGASLRAAGWVCVAELAPRGSWAEDSKQRARQEKETGNVARKRWEIKR